MPVPQNVVQPFVKRRFNIPRSHASAPPLSVSRSSSCASARHSCVYRIFQVVDEIYSYCDHVAPWAPGTSRVPSSAFCLLMKLFTLKLTRPQMNEILVHEVCGKTHPLRILLSKAPFTRRRSLLLMRIGLLLSTAYVLRAWRVHGVNCVFHS